MCIIGTAGSHELRQTFEELDSHRKEQLKHNFCKVRVACDFSLIYAGKGKGKGKDKGEPSNASAEVKNVEIVVVCRNSRDVLGEKGARLRLLHHKINGAFGFHEDFLRLFVERQCRDDDSDTWQQLRHCLCLLFSCAALKEPKKPDKVKVPKPKPKPERRREIPENFGPEQWKDCALRCARLDLIFRRNEEVFAPVQMLLQDPLRYGVRLWREYNLRAKPKQRSAEPGDAQPSWDSPVVGDWGVADDWGAPVDVGGWDAPVDDGWGAHDDKDPGSASASLTEEEKMAARAKRFATPSTVKAKPAKAWTFRGFAWLCCCVGC
eukprot:Skav205292  [mRNA]  locus=scaffold8097:25944:28446:+ [translate_table: standard]